MEKEDVGEWNGKRYLKDKKQMASKSSLQSQQINLSL
jgi:hypothetical protein